tara:strand:+ start:818 stop:1261 length:444 start_codon:yes stop_codon:yes gene_type:complete
MFTKNKKKEISRQFIINYFSFLDYLKSFIVTQEKEKLFNTFYNKNLLLKKANPSFFVKKWYESIAIPYHIQILENNIDFFLNKNENEYSNELQNNIDINSENMNDLRIEERIKGCIKDFKKLDVFQKEELVNNIKNLTMLSILYYKK